MRIANSFFFSARSSRAELLSVMGISFSVTIVRRRIKAAAGACVPYACLVVKDGWLEVDLSMKKQQQKPCTQTDWQAVKTYSARADGRPGNVG
jgi:hypothetical protein